MAIKTVGYIPRKDFMILVNTAQDGAEKWELLGNRIEEMSLTMNPNVETISDVTGQNETILDRYQIQTEVTPMRARGDSKLFQILYDIVRNEKTLDQVEWEFMCVAVFDAEKVAENHEVYAAWRQWGIIAVDSFGGGTGGLEIPFTIHWVGPKIYGYYDPQEKGFLEGIDR